MFTHSVKYSIVVLAFFSIAAQGADANKPARPYEVTEIVAPLNPKCEPGFAHSTFTRRMNESGQIVGYHECWEPSGVSEAPFLRNKVLGRFIRREAQNLNVATNDSERARPKSSSDS